MDSQYMATIQMAGFNFAPRNFAFCSGALIAINQNSALFSLIGTIYGGDGRTSFGLPDFRGRAPVNFGSGIGLTPWAIGQGRGNEYTQLGISNLPSHNHSATFTPGGGGSMTVKVNAITGGTATNDPTDAYWSEAPTAGPVQASVYQKGTPNAEMASNAVEITGGSGGGTVVVGYTGGGTEFSNLGPRLAVNFVICMQGIYPSRN